MRGEKLKGRTPSRYAPVYLDMRLVEDLTGHYGLPEPAPLRVHCIVFAENRLEIGSLERIIMDIKGKGHDLFVLPPFPMSAGAALHSIAERCNIGLCATVTGERNERIPTMWTDDGEHTAHLPDKHDRGDGYPFPMIHHGPAKVAMAPLDCFVHPELAVTFAKLGCDLVVLSEEKLSEDSRLLCEIKTVERIAAAVCASNVGLIAMTAVGHYRWEERSIDGPGVCSYEIDISETRRKRFQDRLDFELLLKEPGRC